MSKGLEQTFLQRNIQMASKHIKRCSISLIIIEMQIKAVREHLTPTRISSVQFNAQLCLTLCHPMTRSMPGLPVHHQLLEPTQTHVHRVGDAIHPSHTLSPAPNPSQHQGFFQ